MSQIIKFLRKMYINLNSEKKFDLINYANLKLGLLQKKKFFRF